MIRIDEIYNNTFWPWLEQNRPGTRLFFCDPPGNTGPDALFNLGTDTIKENDYIFFHDQEPIHLDQFEPLFADVIVRNFDLTLTGPSTNPDIVWPGNLRAEFLLYRQHSNDIAGFFNSRPEETKKFIQANRLMLQGQVVVSERGEYVEQLAAEYGWKTHYYFFHAWACQDWFRGYDKTFLIARARDRCPTRTFMSPNRIVAGRRDHRVLFLYNVFKHNLENNHISAPRTCQYEGVDIKEIASKYCSTYPDIEQVFESAELPRLFEGENQQLMHSYQLGNFKEAADSLIYVPTETVYTGRRSHLTEKTFKAIALEMPFVLVAPYGSLAYLREYGFETFSPYIDESYDLIEDPVARIEAVTAILLEIQARSAAAKQELWQQLVPRVEHNYDHFYRGGLSRVLWQELTAMLQEF